MGATSCVRQKICIERTTAFSLPLLLKKEERAGERRHFLSILPSLRLSPRSCLAGRESQKAASVRRAEHNWGATWHSGLLTTHFGIFLKPSASSATATDVPACAERLRRADRVLAS